MANKHHHEKTGHFLPKHHVDGFKVQPHPPAAPSAPLAPAAPIESSAPPIPKR